MSPRVLGIAVAALTAVLWAIGSIEPAHHGFLTSHDLRWYFFPLYEAFYADKQARKCKACGAIHPGKKPPAGWVKI